MSTAVMLVACSKGNNIDAYSGYWQEANDRKTVVLEIKQEQGNYFLNANVLQEKSKPMLLTGQDGKLMASNGIAQIPLALSDDKNTLFVDNSNYKKIDVATKDKLLAHQQLCKQEVDNFKKERDAISNSLPYEERKQLRKDIQDKYKTKFDELKQISPCNTNISGMIESFL